MKRSDYAWLGIAGAAVVGAAVVITRRLWHLAPVRKAAVTTATAALVAAVAVNYGDKADVLRTVATQANEAHTLVGLQRPQEAFAALDKLQQQIDRARPGADAPAPRANVDAATTAVKLIRADLQLKLDGDAGVWQATYRRELAASGAPARALFFALQSAAWTPSDEQVLSLCDETAPRELRDVAVRFLLNRATPSAEGAASARMLRLAYDGGLGRRALEAYAKHLEKGGKDVAGCMLRVAELLPNTEVGATAGRMCLERLPAGPARALLAARWAEGHAHSRLADMVAAEATMGFMYEHRFVAALRTEAPQLYQRAFSDGQARDETLAAGLQDVANRLVSSYVKFAGQYPVAMLTPPPSYDVAVNANGVATAFVKQLIASGRSRLATELAWRILAPSQDSASIRPAGARVDTLETLNAAAGSGQDEHLGGFLLAQLQLATGHAFEGRRLLAELAGAGLSPALGRYVAAAGADAAVAAGDLDGARVWLTQAESLAGPADLTPVQAAVAELAAARGQPPTNRPGPTPVSVDPVVDGGTPMSATALRERAERFAEAGRLELALGDLLSIVDAPEAGPAARAAAERALELLEKQTDPISAQRRARLQAYVGALPAPPAQ